MARNRSLLEYLGRSKTSKEASKEGTKNVETVTARDTRLAGQRVQELVILPSDWSAKQRAGTQQRREEPHEDRLSRIEEKSGKDSTPRTISVSIEQRGTETISGDKSKHVDATPTQLRKTVSDEIRVVVSKLDGSEVEIRKVVFDRHEVGVVDRAFLLDVDYDGERNKAVLIFYDEKTRRLLYWYDRTGHKPYFLTDLPPDKVKRISDLVNHPSFEGIEVVEKIDLLFGVKRVLTKIVTKDPLAVRSLRNKVPIAWEANIRYHVNYIYDRQLIPGLEYSIEGAIIREVCDVDENQLYELAKKVVSAEDKETIELAKGLAKLFETRWFSPPRIALDIEVYTPFAGRIPSPDLAEYPVMSVAFASTDGMRKVLVLAREGLKVTKSEEFPLDVEVEIFDSEFAMMLEVFRIISSYPIVLTFNGDNFDLRYLYRRAQKLGIPQQWIPIKIKSLAKGNRVEYQAKIRTALHIDLYKFFGNRAIQAYAFDAAYKELTLDAISQALLGYGKVQLEEDIGRLDLAMLVKYNVRDAILTLELTTFSNELVWKLMILLMRISKLGLEDVTRTTVSVWIKNMFYWEHRRRNILIPRSEDILRLKGKKVTEATIKGKKYAGAIVIDPPQGVFFNVVVLDYASLYPSIIMRWNLSYETIDPPEGVCRDVREILDEKGRVIHTVCFDKPGITAQLVGLLRDFRVHVYKKKAKDKSLPEDLRNWYDVVQRAMKVYINAAYGVFGAESFPLYAPSVSESVTALGRRTILMSIRKASELGLRILYGDTDSLFVWNPDPQALEELRKWVYENFGLELEVDKVYKFVAFALKKNYIGVLPDGGVVVKGLVAKKRHTPEFIKKLFSEILEDIKTVESPEDLFKIIEIVRRRLQEACMKLRYRLYTLDEVAFKMGLTKPLSEYKKNTPQHVKAALQLVHHGVNIGPGDVIIFVKVKSRDGVKPVHLAKISEIDPQKYLELMKSALEQLFTPLSITWEEVAGISRLV